jgi:hypothetical protein
MSTRTLGIDPEKLEALSDRNRPAFILQKRVDFLRSMSDNDNQCH